jgi:hypothetical protein
MSDYAPPRGDFEAMLRREVERVLADPAFQRSPVQSRLLEYLCEQTLSRNRHISQIAVAVDGLGRPETIDQLTESYPRVQISRLRRNLSLYYARCAPGEGQAVYIRTGDYQLRLAPLDSAYGEQRQREVRAAAANDAAPAAPFIDAVPTVEPGPTPLRRQRVWRAAPLIAAVVGGLILALGSVWLSGRLLNENGAAAPGLSVELGDPAGTGTRDPLLALAAQQANDIASNSFVVTTAPVRQPGAASLYTLQMLRSQSIAARPVIEVSLFDRDRKRVFHDSITIGADRRALLARLNGAFLQMFNPAGAISTNELAAIDKPRTDYECVLKTETDRLEGGLSTALVEDCLRRFANSRFRAYWLSRMAFMGYRNQVLSGGLVEASGEPWHDLQRALAADSSNPFANYMAAKVSFSRGNCEAARPFVGRALTNGNYSGVLMAATATEAAVCPGSLTPELEAEERIASLVEAIPDPNPLLYVYLVLATSALDRPDLTHRLLASPRSEEPNGAMADIHAALETGLASPAAFAANRDRLQQVVDGLIWESSLRQRLMDKLEAVAAYRG